MCFVEAGKKGDNMPVDFDFFEWIIEVLKKWLDRLIAMIVGGAIVYLIMRFLI